jgi:PAS domain S-box-containing protein
MAKAARPSLPALPPGAVEVLLERTGSLWFACDKGLALVGMNRGMRDRLEIDDTKTPDLRGLLRAVCHEPSVRAAVEVAFGRVLGGEAQRQGEWSFTARSGDVRQIRWNLSGWGEGGARVCVAVGEDVTDRRKLGHWARLQNALLEQVPEAVVLADPEGRILHWSGGAERLLGYSPRSALERPLSNILSGDDPRAQMLAWVDRARREGSFELVFPLRRERGDSVECELNVARVQNERGHLEAIAIIAQPVSLPIAPPEPRAESGDGARELDRAVAALIAVPAVVAAPDGTVRAWSRGAERLAAIGAARAKGRRVLDEVLVVPELGWDGLLTRLAGRGKHAAQVEVLRGNGTRTRADLDAVALNSPDGAIDAVLLLLVDRAETDAVIAESRRTKSRALESVFVEGLVRRLLDCFAYFEPDHRIVLARLADVRMLARMVSAGAPLREFDQALRRVQPGTLESELDKIIEGLGEGVSRLRTLSQDAVRFASPEADAPSPVRLSRELEAARDLVSHAFENRVEAEFVVEDLPAARAARGPLLRGLCLVLLAAAESFPPEHGGRVQVDGKVVGDFVLLEVRDNGAGYSSEVQSRIADLDFLAAQSGFAPLFLGMAREAIRAAGGSLELGSAIGTGARLKVSFPVADQPGPVRPLEAQRAAAPKRGNVLLVEEDPLLRRALERHLGEVFEVLAVGSIAEAIAALPGRKLDVAVLSFPRPESFGLRLYVRFTEVAPELGRNCIVVVPPGLRATTRERLVALGAIVLRRPADFTTLRSICDRLVPGELMAIGEELAEAEVSEEPDPA